MCRLSHDGEKAFYDTLEIFSDNFMWKVLTRIISYDYNLIDKHN